jgi:hypothetical protein
VYGSLLCCCRYQSRLKNSMLNLRTLILVLLLLLMLCFGLFYFSFKQDISRLTKLHETAQSLRLTLTNKKSLLDKKLQLSIPVSRSKPIFDAALPETHEILLGFVREMTEQNFSIQTLQPLAKQSIAGVDVLPVNIVITGRLSQLPKLLASLSTNLISIGLGDFALGIDHYDLLTLELKVFVMATQVAMTSKPVVEHSTQISKDIHLLQAVATKQLKMVGYFRSADDLSVLLMLPNGDTQAVGLNSVIGLERGRVVRMSEKEIIISVGQQQVILHYDPLYTQSV